MTNSNNWNMDKDFGLYMIYEECNTSVYIFFVETLQCFKFSLTLSQRIILDLFLLHYLFKFMSYLEYHKSFFYSFKIVMKL